MPLPRELRVEFAGAVYPMMARENERRETFRDDRDRKRFLKALGEMAERSGVRVRAYGLMPNHYNLVRPRDRHAPMPLERDGLERGVSSVKG